MIVQRTVSDVIFPVEDFWAFYRLLWRVLPVFNHFHLSLSQVCYKGTAQSEQKKWFVPTNFYSFSIRSDSSQLQFESYFRRMPGSITLLVMNLQRGRGGMSSQRQELKDQNYRFSLLKLLCATVHSCSRTILILNSEAFQAFASLQWHDMVCFLEVGTLKIFFFSLLGSWKDSQWVFFHLYLDQSFHYTFETEIDLWALLWLVQRIEKTEVVLLYRSDPSLYRLIRKLPKSFPTPWQRADFDDFGDRTNQES